MKSFWRFQALAFLTQRSGTVDHVAYDKIPDEESNKAPQHRMSDNARLTRIWHSIPYIYVICASFLFIWTFVVFHVGTYYPVASVCHKMATAWSPAQSIVKFEQREIKAEFWTPSPYRGAGASVDKAWHDLVKIGDFPIRVDESQLATLGKDPNRKWKHLPDAVGGGIAGYPEVFHQLHCLNLIRMATYPDLYANHTDFADYEPEIVRAHTDHCIELMRLHLQCTAEMTPVLTEELPDNISIQSDFNMLHMCKNFDELKAWTEKNALHQVQAQPMAGHGH